jgi:hypothetical protein
MDEDGNILVLTDAGTLNIVPADINGTITNNAYFTAIDAAGTGEVDLIKADVNDVATLPDGTKLATSAAPSAASEISNKAYADSRSASGSNCRLCNLLYYRRRRAAHSRVR